jgi:RHS repeat-associated protein
LGAALAINTYDEYGNPGANNLGRFQYTGQAWFPELGLYHYKARFYDPATGRFLQTDPIGLAGGLNLYAYAGGDPVNASDPSGMELVVVTGKRQHRADPPLAARPLEMPRVSGHLWGEYEYDLDSEWTGPGEVIVTATRRSRVVRVRGLPSLRYPASGIAPPTISGIAAFTWSLFDPVAAVESAWDDCSGGFSFSCGVSIAAIIPLPAFKAGGAVAKAAEVALPALQRIHSAETLLTGSARFSTESIRTMSTDDIVKSLLPGRMVALRVKPDGRIFNGNTRIFVLEERGYDVNTLPREILP